MTRNVAWLCAGAVAMAAAVATAQDSADVASQVNAAKTQAGPEWAKAADFFCATEAQVAAMKILPSATEGDVEGQRGEPMKVFDNLYFIGQKAVATWALTTSEGIVLIDAGYAARFDDTLIAGLVKVGLDPRRITAAVIAHEHADHYGGARLLQQRFGTQIYMSRAAWDALDPADSSAPGRGNVITIMDGLFERLVRLKIRKEGEPHPLVVGEDSYQRFLGLMADCTRVQLARHSQRER